ncbi:S41 family peptidase [Flagellimonas meridianipacifica]|uniref:Peptidase S41-like protein n=1 Tax=Flagellimonas meridianipacifica TaxID=1080225 RepID=A0A2T0MH39_9FLAO|nr:S41 family peptidase [Allomuricauda pacifica]PRX56891.1 peptidase S41-like protein [Allomuricauda pacifica]
MRRIILLIGILFLFSCQKKKSASFDKEGTWQAIGYGRILHIDKDSFSFYDTSSISCLPLQKGNMDSFGNNLTLRNDTLVQRKGTGIYEYTRLDKMPNICTDLLSDSKRNDPVYNFEVYAEAIKNNYAYFEDNQINWDSLYTANQKKISASTRDLDLYLVMEEIMSVLKDNHGYIEPTNEVYEQASALDKDAASQTEEDTLPEYGDFQMAKLVSDTFLDEDLTVDSPIVTWGKLKGNIGYIHVKSMWLFADLNLPDSLVQKNGYISTYVDAFAQMNEAEYIEKERIGASNTIDRVMQDLQSTDSLIIDVRFNGGGQDVVSLEILKRFNDQRKKVASKKTKTHDGFTPEISIYMEATENAYLKPVFLLTSQQSASATDFFVMASKVLPHITRIGSRSQGALSDALEKPLPNGWSFAISNEVYYDIDGICYESIGIPPHYELNYPEDRQPFFRRVAQNLEQDKEMILSAMKDFKR